MLPLVLAAGHPGIQAMSQSLEGFLRAIGFCLAFGALDRWSFSSRLFFSGRLFSSRFLSGGFFYCWRFSAGAGIEDCSSVWPSPELVSAAVSRRFPLNRIRSFFLAGLLLS